jgi:head-tail adaptor
MNLLKINNFRDLIYIEEKNETQNDDGEILVSYIAFRRCWANSIQNGSKCSFLIRFQRDLPENFRIKFNNKYYLKQEIINVNNASAIYRINTIEE